MRIGHAIHDFTNGLLCRTEKRTSKSQARTKLRQSRQEQDRSVAAQLLDTAHQDVDRALSLNSRKEADRLIGQIEAAQHLLNIVPAAPYTRYTEKIDRSINRVHRQILRDVHALAKRGDYYDAYNTFVSSEKSLEHLALGRSHSAESQLAKLIYGQRRFLKESAAAVEKHLNTAEALSSAVTLQMSADDILAANVRNAPDLLEQATRALAASVAIGQSFFPENRAPLVSIEEVQLTRPEIIDDGRVAAVTEALNQAKALFQKTLALFKERNAELSRSIVSVVESSLQHTSLDMVKQEQLEIEAKEYLADMKDIDVESHKQIIALADSIKQHISLRIKTVDLHLSDAQLGPASERLHCANWLIDLYGGAGEQDRAVVASELVKLPLRVLRQLRAQGTRVVVTRGAVTSYSSELKSARPRGWPPGSTWDSVPGLARDKDENIVIATRLDKCGQPYVPPDGEGHGSANLVLHESFHAYAGDQYCFDSDFVAAREKDLKNLSEYERQPGDAGLEETFAERGAQTFGKLREARRECPHICAYFIANHC